METVIEASENFIFHCKFEKGLSPKTIQAYNLDIKQFVDFLNQKKYSKELLKIEKNVLKEFLQYISDKQPKTIKRKIATLKALFNFLDFEDEININPFRKVRVQIKEPKVLPTVLNIADVLKIFKSAYQARAKISVKDSYSYRSITRDIAILELLFTTGIRVSELCSLKMENIGKNFSYILVKGKGEKERLIQICNKETILALRAYYNTFEQAIEKAGIFFVNRLQSPISDQSVRFMIKKYTALAGIEKNITPHTFRHTFATLLLEEGVDLIYIQHLLGHSSIMTTQIYTHVNQAKQKQILRTKHPRKKFTLTDLT